MTDDKLITVDKFDLSVSTDGNYLMINVGGDTLKAGLAFPHEKAVPLIGLISDAAGKAAEFRHAKPNLKLLLPVVRWEFKHLGESNVVVLSYGLPNGTEISFQVPMEMSAHMRDALNLLLNKKAHKPSLEQLLN